MKSRSIQAALALTILLSVFLFIVSCGTGPQNVSQNQNANEAANAASADPDYPCGQPTQQLKKEKLEKKVLAKINGDKVLEKQYHGYQYYPPGYQDKPPRFRFKVTYGEEGAVEIHFKGDVSGPGKLEALIDFLDEYKKKGCLESVTFTPGPVTGPDDDDYGVEDDGARAIAFRWSYCEWPTVACGKECVPPPCVRLSPTPNARPENSNTNANVISNANSNRVRGNQ